MLSGPSISRHLYGSLTLFLTILIFPLNSFLLAAGQTGRTTSRTIVSRALSLSEPAFFDLTEGESLKVEAQGPAGFSFDIFVYDASTHDLVGRSDDDATEPYFKWTAPASGKYSIVLHNVSTVEGQGIVTIVPRGSKGVGVGDTRLKNRVLVEIPYATDREPGAPYLKEKESIQTYGGEPAQDDKLHYGAAQVSIPRSHQMGELEGCSILKLEFSEDKDKHIVLQKVMVKTANEFNELIAQRMDSSQSHEVLVYVHGFNTAFEDGLRRAAQIKYDLNFEGVTVLYSWPSHGEMLPVAYNQDGRNAELSIPHFETFLTQLATAKGVRTIHVIAHSMGNRVVMHALAERTEATTVHIRHIALMAPDVDAAVFRRLAVSMKSAADQITLYASSRDGALIASELFAGYPRAGEGGPKLIVMPGVIETVDASNVDTNLLGLYHSYFADNSTILSDLYRLLRDDLARRRFGLTEETGAAGKYWVFDARAR